MKNRGSVTLFATLLLTCVFAAVFAFLESARICGTAANAKLSVAQAKDTVLASYDRELWSGYRLLFLNIPDGDLPELSVMQDMQQAAIEGNDKDSLLPQKNYYMMPVHITEVNIKRYQLATDRGGRPFREQAVKCMKETVAQDTVHKVLDWIRDADGDDPSSDLESEALRALEDLNNARESLPEQEDRTGKDDTASHEPLPPGNTVSIQENPLEWVRKVKTNGIFSIILPEAEMSEKSIDLTQCIARRRLNAGSDSADDRDTDEGRLLFQLYLERYFSDYTEQKQDHTLDYELEYMIIGKASDRENIKGVIRRLLLMREAANMVFLEKDTRRQEEAHLIASALSAAVLSPELEPAIQQGVLAAWAFAESVSDVRILMEGGKVPLVKTEDQWRTQIGNLSGSVLQNTEGEKSRGLSYSNYLQLLMWMTSRTNLSFRAMDMIEKNTSVRMDQMLVAADCEYTLEAAPLFWNMVKLGDYTIGKFQFYEKAEIDFTNTD